MERTSSETAGTWRQRVTASINWPYRTWPETRWLEPDRLAWIALLGLMAVAAVFLYHETRDTTFWIDEWDWVQHRRGTDLDTFLRGHNGHLSVVPIAIYKVLFASAGLDNYAPYRGVVIAAHLVCVLLIFVYANRRVVSFLALLAASLILFLGPAWQDILWPFQVAWLISLAAGLGALLMLDRGDRAGDLAGCALLGLSLASASLGVAIAFGLIVDVLWGRRRWRDGWIVGVPLAVYALWWLGYHDTEFLRHNIILAPSFVVDAAAAAIAAVTGLAGQTVPEGPGTLLDWGRPLGIAAAALAIWRLGRITPIPPRVVALLLIPLSFWTLTALNRAQISPAFASRYLYVGAFFVVLLAVELARGTTVRWRAGLLIGVVAAAAIVSNIGAFRDGARFLRGSAEAATADLGALEVARPVVEPDFVAKAFPGYPFVVLTAGSYFAAEKKLGSPADSPAELATRSEGARRVADAQLISLHQVRLVSSPSDLRARGRPAVNSVAGGTVGDRGGCATFRPAGVSSSGAARELQLTLPPEGILVTATGGPANVGLRRFAEGFQPLGRLAPSARATVRIAPDLSARPWHLRVAPTDRATVCALP